ncbi:type IV secretory system conjugative DNA transfer family protein [Antrihabitans sp. YC2-6]|uniref:type IV secretory system conjugative DNA transfer family protein n=1 Tax=Antrihabitans sp. YC2-6 TaxID=2799498 RepID=UPI0018F4E504|nr:type IV secretion system DNA-binding domain-containing protein [Antrihabitans sp. YC2-6]MBJ8343923.1 type IV secretion system DNA-binding domain-containing protein [Antrihabitans sp. YC2-6]
MNEAIIYLLSVSLVGTPAYFAWDRWDKKMRVKQRQQDIARDRYELIHQTGLSESAVNAGIRSLGKNMESDFAAWGPQPTICFEVAASSSGISQRIHVPSRDSEYVVGQLEAHMPGIDITPYEFEPTTFEELVEEIRSNDSRRRSVEYQFGVELMMTNPLRSLRLPAADVQSAKLLKAIQTDFPDEEVLYQLVVRQTDRVKIPEDGRVTKARPGFVEAFLTGTDAGKTEVSDRRLKASEPQFVVSGRIAARASDPKRAEQLVMKVMRALKSEDNQTNKFYGKKVKPRLLNDMVNNALTPRRFGMQLSSSELSSLLAWGIGDPQIAGMRQGIARRLPTTDAIPRVGRVLGDSDVSGRKRPVAVSYEYTGHHMFVAGMTGSGKSVAMSNYAIQDATAGYGVTVFDGGVDISRQRLHYRFLGAMPRARRDDVAVVSPMDDATCPPSINFLDQDFGMEAIDLIAGVFEAMYPSIREGVAFRELLHHGLWTLVERGGYTFIDLASLISPRNPAEHAWAVDLIEGVKDPELKDFWARYPGAKAALGDRRRDRWDQYVEPLLRRVWQLAGRPEIRNIIGQTKSTIKFREFLQENKILAISFAGMPPASAELLAALFNAFMWAAAQKAKATKPNFAYLDEFQIMNNIQGGITDILARGRALNYHLVLGTQFITNRNISAELRDGIVANTGTRVLFKAASTDEARLWSRVLGSDRVSETDLLRQPRFHGIAQIMTGDDGKQDTRPVTFKALPEPPETDIEFAIREMSRQKYGRPVDEVREEIATRRRLKLTRPPLDEGPIGLASEEDYDE